MAEEFPFLMKINISEIQEAQQTPSVRNRSKTTARYIIIKT